jgi:uncharacterized membrane protein HdeD (DUF308 family)
MHNLITNDFTTGAYLMPEDTQTTESLFLQEIQKNSGLTIALGAILLVVGFAIMGSPLVAGISVSLMVGIMLILSGVSQFVFAVKSGKGLLTISIAALTVLIGGYMVGNPGAALASLTIILAAYLIVSGIFEMILAVQVKPAPGWVWALFSGFISLWLGAMIWGQFPLSGAWAIGILLGLRVFFSGWTLLMFGIAARHVSQQ